MDALVLRSEAQNWTRGYQATTWQHTEPSDLVLTVDVSIWSEPRVHEHARAHMCKQVREGTSWEDRGEDNNNNNNNNNNDNDNSSNNDSINTNTRNIHNNLC